jgi:hypothetical protein
MIAVRHDVFYMGRTVCSPLRDARISAIRKVTEVLNVGVLFPRQHLQKGGDIMKKDEKYPIQGYTVICDREYVYDYSRSFFNFADAMKFAKKLAKLEEVGAIRADIASSYSEACWYNKKGLVVIYLECVAAPAYDDELSWLGD